MLQPKKQGALYVSPFVGRLDDTGQNGMDLIKNAKRMLAKGDGHVRVLAASIRSVEQLLCCFFLETDLVTVPAFSATGPVMLHPGIFLFVVFAVGMLAYSAELPLGKIQEESINTRTVWKRK